MLSLYKSRIKHDGLPFASSLDEIVHSYRPFSHVIPLSSTDMMFIRNTVSGRFFSVVFPKLENIIVSLKVLKEVTDRSKIKLMAFI